MIVCHSFELLQTIVIPQPLPTKEKIRDTEINTLQVRLKILPTLKLSGSSF